jgi:hypothetical protein
VCRGVTRKLMRHWLGPLAACYRYETLLLIPAIRFSPTFMPGGRQGGELQSDIYLPLPTTGNAYQPASEAVVDIAERVLVDCLLVRPDVTLLAVVARR